MPSADGAERYELGCLVEQNGDGRLHCLRRVRRFDLGPHTLQAAGGMQRANEFVLRAADPVHGLLCCL